MNSQTQHQRVWDSIRDATNGLLTSRLGKELKAWPVSYVQQNSDGTLWLYADAVFEDASGLKNDKDVCVTFFYAENKAFLRIVGYCSSVSDRVSEDMSCNAFALSTPPEFKNNLDSRILEMKIKDIQHFTSTGF